MASFDPPNQHHTILEGRLSDASMDGHVNFDRLPPCKPNLCHNLDSIRFGSIALKIDLVVVSWRQPMPPENQKHEP